MPRPRRRRPRISLVIPVHNNQHQLVELTNEIRTALKGEAHEVIFVEDGSTDLSWTVITELVKQGHARQELRGIRLSRNFGQHQAILAGLQKARGDYTVVLDADLQDNPAFIPEMLNIAEQGFDIVHGKRRPADFGWHRVVRACVHWILTTASEVPLHQAMGNFKLLSSRAREAVIAYGKVYPLLELMVQNAGFSVAYASVERRRRQTGKSTYNLRRSLDFIFTVLVHYSSLFFRWAVFAGIILMLSTPVVCWLLPSPIAIGWLITLAVVFQSGLTLTMAGITGLYVRNLQMTGRDWPVYIIREEVSSI